MSGLLNRIHMQMDRHLDKTAIYCEGNTITYRELEKQWNAMTILWQERDVVKGDKIAVLLPNSIEFVICMLTAAGLGAVIVPLDPKLPAEAIKTAFESSDVRHVVSKDNVFPKIDVNYIKAHGGFCLSIDNTHIPGVEILDEAMEYEETYQNWIDVEDDADFIFTLTSGSTGAPKPIVLSHKNKYDRALSCIKSYSIHESDVILAATPLYHSLAERLVLVPLLVGATSVIMNRYTPGLWIDTIKEQQVSFTIAVSSQLAQIIKCMENREKGELKSLRAVVSSSALLAAEVKDALLTYLECDFYECYGTSETAVITDIGNDEAKLKLNSVGKPLENVSIKIIDDDGRELGYNQTGEIICKTYMLFKSYYHMEQAVQEAMVGEYFATGDLGYVDEDGYLYYVSRKKEIIVTGAVNVYPSDIERVLLQLPEIQECAAFPYPDERLGETIAVAIVLKEEGEVDKKKLKFHCLEHLAPYQQPRHYFFLNELPKNAMGKLMRYQLGERILEHIRNEVFA